MFPVTSKTSVWTVGPLFEETSSVVEGGQYGGTVDLAVDGGQVLP